MKEKKNKKCNCKDENCNCGENCNCKENCECGENCNCGGDCNCNKDSKCNEECNCESGCKCGENCKCKKEAEDKYLRLQAEFINFRNRTSIEVSNLLKYEGEKFIKELLTTVDNFERAITMDDNNDLSDEVSKFLSGFKMIYGNLKSLLDSYEIKEIDALGKEFNPTYMDAVLTEHDETKPANVVVEVLTKGYMYKDKVIRPAMVKVNN